MVSGIIAVVRPGQTLQLPLLLIHVPGVLDLRFHGHQGTPNDFAARSSRSTRGEIPRSLIPDVAARRPWAALQRPRQQIHLNSFCSKTRDPFVGCQPDLLRDGGQSGIGIIHPQMQPGFGPGSEHAIGFVRAFGDQIVDHDPDVGLAAAKTTGFPPRIVCAALIPAIKPCPAASS